MKTKSFTLLAILFALPLFYSCGEDKNTIIDEPEEKPENGDFDITEVSESNLSPGQTAKFTKNDDGSYTLTLKGTEFDLSSVEGNPCNGIVEVPGPVLGMRECSFPVSIVENDDKNGYTFSGTFKNEAIEFSTKGTIEKELITFRNSTIVEQAFMPDAPETEDFYNYYFWLTQASVLNNATSSLSLPFSFEWETSTHPFEADSEITMSEILQTILITPFLSLKEYGFDKAEPDIVSPITLFTSFVSGISINTYGKSHSVASMLIPSNAVAETTTGSTFYKQSFLFPVHTFEILPINNNKIRLFINPGYLFDIEFNSANYTGTFFQDSSHTEQVRTPATFTILSNIASAFCSDSTNGLEMDYSYTFSDDNKTGVLSFTFAQTSTALKFLKAFLLPLIENDANKKRLSNELIQNPMFKNANIKVDSFIDGLPSLLDSTTELEFGFNNIHLSGAETEKELENVYHRLF